MPRSDLTLPELRRYQPDVAEPEDFDSFWADTLSSARELGSDPVMVSVATALQTVDVFDVTFPGFAGDPIRGWFLCPKNADAPLPAVVEFNGYGGGRGLHFERLSWVSAGYAYLFVDTRGQGATWGTGGSTPDPHGSAPAAPGFMTRGLTDPTEFFYRRVFTDAVRAVDAVRTFPQVDPQRVVVTGGSQGGGMTLAVAALAEGLVAAMPDVPFLTDWERAMEVASDGPYLEIVRYLSVYRGAAADVFRTLSYFDGVNMAKRAKAPALFSVALLDPICPPSTVFAAYNAYAGKKEITVYPYNQHEGGGPYQWESQVKFLRSLGV